jgi:hypothetical protein
VELESQRAGFRDGGLEVAALSYDSPAVLKDFAARRGITYPLLSDSESIVIRRFGLLNPEYPPGDNAHGVPHPGTFVVDETGVIREKHFARGYTERRTAASLRAAEGRMSGAPAEQRAPHFTLRTGLSNTEAVPGQRVTLIVDLEMRPGHHAYAPGAHSYRPLALKLEPTPYARFDAPRLPPSRSFEFKPLRETVPVFEGRFRLLQDVVVAVRDDIAPLLASPEPTLLLEGRLEYQVCSDTVCFPPGSLPVRFALRVKPLDRERVPETLRRPPIVPFSAVPPGPGLPGGWRPLTLPGIKPPQVEVVADEGTSVLRVFSRAGGGTVAFALTNGAAAGSRLAWRWKIDRVVERADLHRKSADDFAARVYVFFDVPGQELSLGERAKRKLAKLLHGVEAPAAVICYVWDNRHPVGTSAWSPYSRRVRTVVLQSGNGRAGQWVAESRDVDEDFRAAFGTRGNKSPPRVSGVAVGNDTDQTGQHVTAWFGDLRFAPRPGS